MTQIPASMFPEQARVLEARSRALWHVVVNVAADAVVLVAGLALAFSFNAGHYLPTRISVALLYLLAAIGVMRCRFGPFSPLTRLMIVLYASAFVACYGYLFNDHYFWFYSPLSVAYMSDPVTIQIMTMTGLIGLCGLLTGYLFASQRTSDEGAVVHSTRTLRALPFIVALLAACAFAMVSVPAETFFSTLYTAAGGVATRINFNAASMVGFTLLMLLVIDAEQEARPAVHSLTGWGRQALRRARRKRAAVIVTTALIVVYLLLHGRRDSFGYLLGLAAMYVTEPLPAEIAAPARRRRVVALSVAGFTVLAIFFAVGDIRNRAAVHEELPFLETVARGITEGFTGTGVLLTNLSLAHSYRYGLMTVERGQTYVDYLRSLPPGFVTYALGVERPIELDRGPNFWFTDISAGGIHVVTVPFRNFLAPGAFLIMMLYGYLIARSEVIGQRSRWLARFWYGAMFVCAALWFWYGDILLVREAMTFGIAAVLYALVRRVSIFGRKVEAPAISVGA